MNITFFILFGLTTFPLLTVAATSCSCMYTDCIGWKWDEWSPWGSCTQSCAGGVRYRAATCFNFRKLTVWINRWLPTARTRLENQKCGELCLNGGSFIDGKCSCPSAYTGVCCEKLPVCDPKCQNGGECIADNTCRCPSNIYGQFCEIGSEIEEGLQAHFNPTVSRDFVSMSWYDAPMASGDNEICYIKITVQNASYNTIITAVSKRQDDHSRIFGNFTAAPIDSESKLKDAIRFVCLKVRCPGVAVTEDTFDVTVEVTVSSPQRKCSVMKSEALGNVRIMSDDNGGHDVVVLELQGGNNYGEMYGIYVGTGFRDKAEYLAKQSCFSGNRFTQHSFQPGKNHLLQFTCE